MVLAPMSVKASPTTVEVINPLNGTHDFNFTSDTTNVGDQFDVDIMVFGTSDMDLQNWQVKVTWDASMLSFVSIWLPDNHVFAPIDKSLGVPPPLGRSMSTPAPLVDPDAVTWGCTYINDPYWTFNGTGILCKVKLQITKDVSQGGPTEIHCTLGLGKIVDETFILNHLGSDITVNQGDLITGTFRYSWVMPSYYPTLYIKPAISKPAKIGDIVPLQIWVKNVHQGWEIIGFQFSLMWDTKFIEPASPYYTNGTFLEGFQYFPGGVMYAADINTHSRPMPLTPIPDDYNYSMFGLIMLPDSPIPYHTPFPHTSPDGLLMTVYFKAIYETISPVEDWTWIEFIDFKVDEDTYALNQYINTVPASAEDCHYRAPMKILGLAIDLYTQYDPPYGGQGPDMPSDMFGPQQLVDLFALVTYNEYPVQQKLVGFEVRHGDYVFWREAATDEKGIAHVSFRLPWPCEDPVAEIFGKWIVIATVEVAEQVKNDTLGFWVWWKVEVLSVEPKQTEFVQRKTGGDDLLFTLEYATYSMQTINVTLTTTVYDELGFFIGSDYLTTTVGWGEYKYYDYLACETPPLKTYDPWDITIPLPTNAVVGKGTVFGNAFDKFPWLGGTPYCPEVTNTIDFYIAKP